MKSVIENFSAAKLPPIFLNFNQFLDKDLCRFIIEVCLSIKTGKAFIGLLL